ncbi:Membrane protein involved in the export of O-antigen and teichoic acid [Bryocella elongata]|uniref:Membrane protein involved in the export of O-antigen and teichoic acid n=1 Tax=Bryocella elongata TaxID=863522 RepID=A0A1H6BHG0_9BACT|nr:lipopolysaccharide biosynthesis protein [Bryocella elongata]SEG60032.1 Membrane protein involved in the export of O-antigen and teichoic acid [Bryocella elongata]
MDEHVRKRLLVGFLTNIVSKASGTLIQLVQVPVMFHYWGQTMFGVWAILTGLPAYLSFSNTGFGTVAGNEMTMRMARGEQDEALGVFQSCWWLISLMMGCIGVVFCVAIWLLPMAHLLNLDGISEHDTSWALFWLGLSMLFNQLETLLQASYRCIARYSYGNFLKSMFTIIAFAIQIAPIVMGYGPRTVAMVFALANISITLILCVLVKRDIPWISYGWNHASFAEIKRLTRPSIAFMGFPLGQSLNLQGSQMAVNYALGPGAVAVFSTGRTVSRLALQAVEMVKNTVWPELSIAFGSGNWELVRTLHRRACQIALFFSLAVMVVVAALGPPFLHHWTMGKVPADMKLIGLLLLVVVLYSLWSTSATLVSAINMHERLATVYTVATGCTVLVTYACARHFGLYGAAASLMLAELVMDVYVLPASLKISHDTWPGFLRAVLHWPESLRPAALLRRLRGAGAAAE